MKSGALHDEVPRRFLRCFRAAVVMTTPTLQRLHPREEPQEVHAEALLLLSRLLFLAFVQEEGWLAGKRRFLQDQLAAAVRDHREYFSGVLLPLFFGCLNTPSEERTAAARRLGDIPYLNGGLFRPSCFELRHPEMRLPNALLQRIFAEVFAFDFRLENDLDDLCIDPDMLGRVFESLMAAPERSASGTFYTPRELADVIAEQAIAAWLGPEPTLDALERITILDPACGSGAFLVAALRVLLARWRKLSRKPPDIRHIVSSSLFGVDLHPEAVRLCELRLWLAIAAEPRGTGRIEPLPNLDRNILQGDSLVDPIACGDEVRHEVYSFSLDELKRQRGLLRRYRTTAHSEQAALRGPIRENDRSLALALFARSIERTEETLRAASTPVREGRRLRPIDMKRCRELYDLLHEQQRALDALEDGSAPVFSYDVHLAPYLATGGFDVILGNPPWVSSARLGPPERRQLARRYALFRGDRVRGEAPAQSDVSVAFAERALSLAAKDGVVGMLLPAKVATSDYGRPFRRAVAGRLVTVADWSPGARKKGWFDAAAFPLGVIVRAHRTSVSTRLLCDAGTFEVPPRELTAASSGAEWTIAPPAVLALLHRLRAAHPPLADALRREPRMGVKTGQNEHFFLADARMCGTELVTRDDLRIPLAAVCRCVRGRDVRRWHVKGAEWMLWPPAFESGAPPAWLARYAAARGIEAGALRLAFVRGEHLGLRVAWKDLSHGMAAVVMPEDVIVEGQRLPLVPNQTLYSLSVSSLEEAHAHAAVLNSTIASALLLAIAERVKDAHYRFLARTVASLPWPNIDTIRPVLARLSRAAHDGAEIGADLDALVARAYGVSDDELRILRTFVEERLR